MPHSHVSARLGEYACPHRTKKLCEDAQRDWRRENKAAAVELESGREERIAAERERLFQDYTAKEQDRQRSVRDWWRENATPSMHTAVVLSLMRASLRGETSAL